MLTTRAWSVPTSSYRDPAVGDPRGLWEVLWPEPKYRRQETLSLDTLCLPSFLSFSLCGFSSETVTDCPAAKHVPRPNSLPSLSTSSASYLCPHPLATTPLPPWLPPQASPRTLEGADNWISGVPASRAQALFSSFESPIGCKWKGREKKE